MDDTPPLRGCSWRALSIGLILAAFMGLAIPWGDMIIKGSQMGVWNTSPGAIFLFAVLVGLVNLALRYLRRPLALDKSELAVVYILILIANTLPARGFAGYVMPIATGAHYYATPENDWSDKLWPLLPDWVIIQDERVVRQYYEGADQVQAGVPWDAWAGPLLYWLLFGLALYLVMTCLSVILRRQWVERERLVYPTMQLPLHMIEERTNTSAIPAFFKNRIMWLGFLLPFVITNVKALSNYFHYIPAISTSFGSMTLFRDSIGVGFTLSFTLLGFSFLISRNIAAGLCFFYFLNVCEQGLFRMLGIKIDPGPVGAFGHYADGIIIYQAMGGMIVLVLIGLWNARSHLRDVWRKAFTQAKEIDDSDEIMSYRQAVLGGLLGLTVMTAWLWRAGLPLWIVPLLLAACFCLFITITRVVAEGGVVVMFPPITGPDFIAAGVGPSLLGPRGAAGLATTYVWGTDILILFMSACTNGLKLAEVIGRHKKRLFWGIMATVLVTLVASLWVRLETAYEHGAINLNRFYAANSAWYPYRHMDDLVSNPTGPYIDGWIQVAVGVAIMAGLELLHYKFLWWPFHPLGFPISSAFGSMWFSVFVAYILKSVILKYGGPNLYRQAVPFFLGLILGEIVPAGCWLVIDFFTGMQGNTMGAFLG